MVAYNNLTGFLDSVFSLDIWSKIVCTRITFNLMKFRTMLEPKGLKACVLNLNYVKYGKFRPNFFHLRAEVIAGKGAVKIRPFLFRRWTNSKSSMIGISR